jgi:hypothetical protein
MLAVLFQIGNELKLATSCCLTREGALVALLDILIVAS